MATFWEYLWAGSWITKWLYHLNGSSTDSSWNSQTGTDTSISYTNWLLWQWAWFNGSSSQIALPNLWVSWGTARTLSMWIKATTITSLDCPFRYWTNTSRAGFAILLWWLTTNDVYLAFANNDVYTATNAVSTWSWYNIVCIYDWWTISTSTAHIYINWEIQSITQSVTSAWAANTANSNYWIWYDPITAGRNFDWVIDEVILENVAWSAGQVKRYYTYAKWRFAIL